MSGDLATAASEYQQAIHLDGSSMVAHYDLGTVYDQQRSSAQAVSEYQAALVIDPSFPDALFNLAVDTAGSNPESASILYSRVVSLQPSYAAAWLNLGFRVDDAGRRSPGEGRLGKGDRTRSDPGFAPSKGHADAGCIVIAVADPNAEAIVRRRQ